ncbi:uncharacterized protein LOC131546625 isoform X2 [Onychostoma macrolepis]|uniref:uncharacterized protein LOC131546625 isoform X2 n=1 Tax=Onychostoma macrolepis TaxID=369639 RepID=UPI00272A10F3|nr:uncharacterized protein LOC131546625 isoform X2 [Onychostoma macrolepis]
MFSLYRHMHYLLVSDAFSFSPLCFCVSSCLHPKGSTALVTRLWLYLSRSSEKSSPVPCDPNQPHEDTVKCYKTLVQQLTESGIKPLLVLHRSAVPELFRARYGGWENPLLVQMFEQYAGFVFNTFRDLVDTFIMFSHLHELHEVQLQNAVQSHANVYNVYHQMFKGKA